MGRWTRPAPSQGRDDRTATSGASVGFVVAVFQWGWGRAILGLSENVPIESSVPMMMFAIVFGLSLSPPP